jgi:hypothetical protein
MQLSHSSWFAQPAFRIQYIPQQETPQEDQPDKPPAPTDLVTATAIERIAVSATVADLVPGDLIEFYSSIDNNRTNAERVGYGAQNLLVYTVPVNATRYHWTRIRRPQPGVDSFSEFYPLSPTGGIVGTSSTVDNEDIAPGAVSQREISFAAGPVTVSSTGVVHTYTFTANHAGELVIAQSYVLDFTNVGTLEIGWSTEVIDGSGTVVPDIASTVSGGVTDTRFSHAARTNVVAGSVTVRINVDEATGSGSVDFNGIVQELLLLKR